MKTVYLDRGGPSDTWRTRPALTQNPQSGDQTSSKVRALHYLWRSPKQRRGAICFGLFTRLEAIRAAWEVILA